MQNRYLISLAIGPVQDFIAAARRTRDLWFGSYVLSEVSKAAAESFQIAKGELIFPAPETNLTADSNINVGNKILLLIQTNDPKVIVTNAKSAAIKRWETLANQAKKGISVEPDIWEHQIADVLEFFSAWVLLEDVSDYGKSGKGRKRVEQLLNARKNTREFRANPVLGDFLAKSSLDGLRESVLNQNIKQWQKRKLGLSAGEQLDCIGVVKRLGGNAEQFTPLSRLAIDPWLRNLQVGAEQGMLSDIKEILSELHHSDLGLVSIVNNKIYNSFPFDGQLLYDSRIQAEQDGLSRLTTQTENQTDLSDINLAENHLTKLEEKITSSPFKNLPKANPYMAILAADGDRMGELLDSMNSIQDHQEISAKLAEFATEVPETVRDFNGHCIYAGGDDVLALLPLDKATACARKLADDFKNKLKIIANKNTDEAPTLSVGLGISHFLTPMGKQLDLARRAEQLAKSNDLPKGQSKNSLAILLQPRSGAEINFRERWHGGDINNHSNMAADEVLGKWIAAHNENLLPRRIGYELREASLILNWCKDKSFIEKETSRILERKRKPGGSLLDQGLIDDICKRAAIIGLAALANELIITRRIAEVHKLSGEPIPGVKS